MAAAHREYKSLIFDLGRVLVYFDFSRAYRALEAFCPCPALEMPKRLLATDMVRRIETGRMTPEEFHAEFANLLAMDIGFQPFCDIWTSIFTHELLPETLLENLAQRYRLVLLSNTNPIHFEMIRAQYPHLRHFHDLVLSYQVGALKPEPAIYQAAIASAGCKPEECFYTDDIPEFIEGGRKAGLDAVQFESHEQLLSELRARGILP